MENTINDSANTTTETTITNAPKVITLSQMEVLAFRAMSKSRAWMANYYGITSQEMYEAMVTFGIYENRESKESNPTYVVNYNFDMPSAVEV